MDPKLIDGFLAHSPPKDLADINGLRKALGLLLTQNSWHSREKGNGGPDRTRICDLYRVKVAL
jgi:hypothetical protein